MQNDNNKKKVLIGLGLFWSLAITASAIAVPLVLAKQKSPDQSNQGIQANSKQFVKTSWANFNEKQVNIKIQDLDDYQNRWLVVEYKQAPTTPVAASGSDREIMQRSFFVKSKTEFVSIGGLVPNIDYEYKIKDKSGEDISEAKTFVTYSKPELKLSSDKNSISLISSELNKEYLYKSIIVRYKPFDNSIQSPNDYTNSNELDLVVELKEIGGKSFYAISGTINDLKDGTPYVLTLHIAGQEGTISDPIIAWTKGGGVKLIMVPPTTLQIAGLDDYVADGHSNSVFYVNFVKKGDTSGTVKKVQITLGTDAIVSVDLTDLDPNTQYVASLFRTEEGIEEATSDPIEFWTPTRPYVKTQNINGFETNWAKSPTGGSMVISGLKSASGDLSLSQHASDLVAVAVEVTDSNATPDFSVKSAISANLEASDSDQHAVNFTGLTPGKQYAIQIFQKTDTDFAKPLLKDNFLEATTPSIFSESDLNLEVGTATLTLANVNGYKSGETILEYWKKSDPTNKTTKPINFPEEATEAVVVMEPLEQNQDYDYRIVPVYTNLQKDTDKLLSGSFNALGVVKAVSVSGNNFTDNMSFKFNEIGNKFPIAKDVKLQWRLKPATTTEWNAPTDTDSVVFQLAATPTDKSHTVEVTNNNRVETWFSGVTYEWRIVDPSTGNTDLMELKNNEFSLEDDQITQTFKAKVSPNEFDSIVWHTPEIQNIVGSALGGADLETMWRPFFGLDKKEDWQHLLEWLAFQPQATQDKLFAQMKLAFQAFVPRASATAGQANEITKRWTAVPFKPEGTNGTIADFKDKAAQDNPRFGGYVNTEYASDSPIKPSDFMSASSKFKNLDAIMTSIKYYLKGIKDGWNGRSTNIGITRSNIFAKAIMAAHAETYATYVDSKAKLNGNFALATVATKASNGWTIEAEDNTASRKNFYANDITGELFVRLKMTKGGKSHYYWHKISGFKTSDETTKPVATDLTFKLHKDHAKNARIMQWELSKLTDVTAKKALLEKYFNIKLASIFVDDWTFVSSSLTTAGKLQIVAQITKKKVAKATIANLIDETELTSDENFTFELEGYDFSALPTFSYAFGSNAKANLGSAATGVSSDVRYYSINWTYEQMLNKMKDAFIQGDVAMNALAKQIIDGLGMNSDWQHYTPRVYFRTMGNDPLASWGDYSNSNWNFSKTDERRDGFLLRDTLLASTEAARKAALVSLIKQYAQK